VDQISLTIRALGSAFASSAGVLAPKREPGQRRQFDRDGKEVGRSPAATIRIRCSRLMVSDSD
jgi:hypothetical protein